jgi:hypothetical protein
VTAATLDAAAYQLTDAHRVAQANIALDSVGQLTAAWKTLMTPSNLDNFAAYMQAMTGVIKSGRATSAQVAAAYYDTMRTLYDVEGLYDPVIVDDAPDIQIQTSLLVTGPVRVKTLLANGDSMNVALTKALLASAGATTRLVADAGRGTVRGNVLADDQAEAWRRVTDGHPCSFCAMLAGRGAVYKDPMAHGARTSASEHADPYHDHCLCTVEPQFVGRIYRPGRKNGSRHGR